MTDRLTLLAADENVMRQAAVRFQELITMAAEVGAPLVTVGGFRGRLAWAGGTEARSILIRALRDAAEFATKRGVRLVLEPLNRYETDVLQNVEQVLAFVNDVGCDNVGLLLDTFHANIEEPSLTECLRQGVQAGRLWHVHVGDSNRLAPGQGHLDFEKIIATLREVGYQGYVSAELLPQPDADTAAALTARHMRKWLPARN